MQQKNNKKTAQKLNVVSKGSPNIKLLIVEDNQILQCCLKAMLFNLGLTADIASDGKTALALYNQNYRLILMDIDLPDINGIEVTKTIRWVEKKKSCHVPIIAMTSHAGEPEYEDKCLSAGMDGFSGKPNAAQLKSLIETYCTN